MDLLTKKLRDQGVSEAERIQYAEKAKAIRDNIFQTDIKNAKENERIITGQQALNSKKDFQAITDAKNRVTETSNAYKLEEQGIENRESRLEKNKERAGARAAALAQKEAEDLAAANAGLAQANSERLHSITKMLQDEMDGFAKELSMLDESYREKLFKEQAFQAKMQVLADKTKSPAARAKFLQAKRASEANEKTNAEQQAADRLKLIEANNEKMYEAVLKGDLELKQLQNESQQNQLTQKLATEDLKLDVTLDGLEKEKAVLEKSIRENKESVTKATGDELAAIQSTLDRELILLKQNNAKQEAETKASAKRKKKIQEDAAQADLMDVDQAEVIKTGVDGSSPDIKANFAAQQKNT